MEATKTAAIRRWVLVPERGFRKGREGSPRYRLVLVSAPADAGCAVRALPSVVPRPAAIG